MPLRKISVAHLLFCWENVNFISIHTKENKETAVVSTELLLYKLFIMHDGL